MLQKTDTSIDDLAEAINAVLAALSVFRTETKVAHTDVTLRLVSLESGQSKTNRHIYHLELVQRETNQLLDRLAGNQVL